jgi:hypothetical protein
MAKKPVRGVRGRAWSGTSRRTGARRNNFRRPLLLLRVRVRACGSPAARADVLPTETGRGQGGETATARYVVSAQQATAAMRFALPVLVATGSI